MPESSVVQSIRTWFGRTFQAREVFLRKDGHVRYFTISGRVQLCAAASLLALGLWAFVGAGGLILRGAQLEEKSILLDEALESYQSLLGERERYQALIEEVERDYQLYSSIVQELESNQLILLNLLAQESQESQESSVVGDDQPQEAAQLSEEAGIGQTSSDTENPLEPKLDFLRQQLADVAAKGSVLENRSSEITTALMLTQSERIELQGARDALARRLQNLRADFDKSQEAREAHQQHIAGLKIEVATLLSDIGSLEDQRDELTVSLAERTIEIATWQDRNSQLEDALKRQVDSLSLAEKRNKALSAGWSLKYADLSAERDVLGQQISGLNNHISQLGEQNMDAVIRLRKTAELAVESLEKTIEATGLAPNDLLTIAGLAVHEEAKPHVVADVVRLPAERRSVSLSRTLGRGGPYVGYDGDDYSTAHSELSDALDLLDTKLERWKVLQDLMRAIPLSAPLEEFEITSYYGTRRDPLNGRKAQHLGMDFGGDKRASVYATAPGRVTKAGWYGQFGKFVEIDHGFGIKTRYAHLNDVIVKRGDGVTSRQKIGTVGTTGRSTGPHVHYEIHFNGTPQNPAKFLTAGNNVFKE